MRFDFVKNKEWNGSLYELINLIMQWIPDKNIIKQSHLWAREKIQANSILPVRKFKGHSKRGELLIRNGKQFLIVDNEPLASLYKVCIENSTYPTQNDLWQTFFSQPHNRASAYFEEKPDARYLPKYKLGVLQSNYRDSGILLAHLWDAAKGIIGDDYDVCVTRYLRSQSLQNIIPFPSSRKFFFEINGIRVHDPSGDQKIQKILRGVFLNYLGMNNEELNRYFEDLKIDAQSDIAEDWEDLSKNIIITILPRAKPYIKIVTSNKSNVCKHQLIHDANTSKVPACKITKSDGILNIEELIEYLRHWIAASEANQLDAENASNPGNWVYWKADFFSNEHGEYLVNDKEFLSGSAYNGVYALHGDFKRKAAEKLISMFDSGLELNEIFRFSQTFESKNTQKNKTRMLKLKDDDDTNGFYSYWQQG